ncbi:MAG: DNA mismatch repair protein MutS [Candidatus Rokubacteria bacterium]|nr:DNA mismatch repair protein MutS [Candidatus Rokubacteria bacterium]
MPDPALTPMMTQYRELKQRYPDFMLLFRLGDFYELFLEDAERGARILSITLTSRQGAPMAGIPHHAAESYIARLIQAGQKVAICEQMEAPGKGKKLLRRQVVRVVTPGTVTDTAYLAGGTNNFLLAVVRAREGTGVALVDVSTGEFWAGEDTAADDGVLAAALLRRPSEIVLPESLREATDLLARLTATGATLSFTDAASFGGRRAGAELCAHFGVSSLEPFGVGGLTVGLQAAAGALGYLRATQGDALGHLTRLQRLHTGDALALDATAVVTLELIEASAGGARGSLFGVLDETVTPMGARLLRQWMLRPLLDPDAIRARQDAIAALVEAPAVRDQLRRLLRRVGDLERLTSRAILGLAHARDLVGLRTCLDPLDDIRRACAALSGPIGNAPGGAVAGAADREGGSATTAGSARTGADTPSRSAVPATALLETAREEIAPLADVRALLNDALEDEPPLTLHDGGLIREGWDERLGAIVTEAREAREWIAGLEERERARTGIGSLRVRFNRVFGYGIEVTHAQAARVPDDYVRRQTLAGAERYVTTELKEYEAKVLGADERRRRLEYDLFDDVRRRVAGHAVALLATARALARLDVFAALAEVAHVRGHVRPVVDRGDALVITEGRHPVLEARAEAPVTANDLALDDAARIVILTGPNMAGKSVYLRQTGHIVLMAQMGAFVPAREARIGVVDRLFTRVGAQDNLSRGQSTFLVEMVETATILNNVTPRSLVLLDEVGRGTSTFDGLAIAWAVVEALHDACGGGPRERAAAEPPGAREFMDRPGPASPKVLFATHFHELTQLADRLAGVRNFHVAVREWNDEIIFLHKVRAGSTDRSYGIQVARLAGLPAPVIARAKALLAELEATGNQRADVADAEQLGLFVAPRDPIVTELAHLDLAHVTPIEALNLLAKWQARQT